ncbi:hypothetical protein [Tissierella sp.]|uniref:hypothetical protein n=1 Tax=Tissierella sp. TaxID=41274 RepID=UPI0030645A67
MTDKKTLVITLIVICIIILVKSNRVAFDQRHKSNEKNINNELEEISDKLDRIEIQLEDLKRQNIESNI